MPTLTFISDTHGLLPTGIKPCDILVHCGDMLPDNKQQHEYMYDKLVPWLKRQPAKHVVLVPGNHDWLFVHELPVPGLPDHVHVLLDSGIRLEGLKLYGTSWTPWFNGWAFNAPEDPKEGDRFLQQQFTLIPNDVEVLITHGPPRGVLDLCMVDFTAGWLPPEPAHVGCRMLRKRVDALKRLRVHAFGHVHGNRQILRKRDGRVFINAALAGVKASEGLTNKPVTIQL